MRALAYLFLLLSFAGAGGAAWWLAEQAARIIESQTEQTVTTALSAAAQDWPEVEVDGTRVTLRGLAPTEAAGFRAIEVARGIVGAERFTNRVTMRTAQEAEGQVELGMTIVLNPNDVTVLGMIPEESVATLEIFARRSERPVRLLAEVADRDAPAAWSYNLLAMLDVAPLVRTGRVTFGPRGEAVIEAALASAQQREEIERRVRASAPPGTAVSLELAAPPQTLAPYPFTARKDQQGLVIETCATPDAATEGRIAMALDGGEARCVNALGAPQDWGAAVVASLSALDQLGQGQVTLESTLVELTIGARTADVIAAQIATTLEESLPADYTLIVVQEALPVSRNTPRAAADVEPFTVTRMDGIVTIRGEVADAAAVEAVTGYAQAAFPGLTLDIDLQDMMGGPATTVALAIASVEAATLMMEGDVRATAERLDISGRAPGEDLAEEMRAALSARLPEATDIAIDIEIMEQSVAEVAEDPSADPALCLADVQGIQTPDARIGFAPSSANLDISSAPVLDALAARLRACPDLAFIVAGYTDNQGREELNQRISESRANAVVDALLARGVFLDRMRAVGLGEADPVADNETEEGRALNRRIEFLRADAVSPPEAAEQDAVADTETGEDAE